VELVFEVQGRRSEVPIAGEPLTIGRAATNTLSLVGVGLAPRHGVIRRRAEDGALVVEHLAGSAGATRLNGRRLAESEVAPIAPGDRLRLGELELSVVDPEAPERPSAGPGPAAFELLLDTIGELHRREDPVELLPVIVDRVIGLTGADRGLLLVRGPDGLESTVARDRQGALAEVSGASRSVPRRVLETGEPVAVVGDEPGAPEARSDSMREHDLHAVLCLPIRSRGSIAGVVYVDARGEDPRFGPERRRLLEAFAAQCGTALERARLRRLEVAERRRLEEENAALRRDPDRLEPLTFDEGLRALLRDLERVAASEVTVLLTGETGVGKEVVARFVHDRSRRRAGPFQVVDCGAIPAALLESVLFGHREGAFTGATASSPGLVGEAQGGTLLLDEIGELPLELQPKLLRFLEERTYRPIGSEEALRSDVRILATTQRDLPVRVEAGRFRRDLYFRLSGFTARVPPLRERPADLEPLARLLLGRARRTVGAPSLTGFTHEALAGIRAHAWPGNVRELAHRIERAAVVAEPPFVTLADLDLPAGAGAGSGHLPLKDARRAASDRFEVEYVSEMLRRHRGVVARAAQDAGVSRQMFQRLMAKHGLVRDAFLAPRNGPG